MTWRRWTSLLSALVIVAATTAAALAIRFYIVEPEEIARACMASSGGWRCIVRDSAVYGFLHNAFGWTALLTGAFATVIRWRWLAAVAIVAGVAGAVLYTFELSGAGLLLGALVWTHRAPMSDAQSRDAQHA
jgi:hypothetical protein